MNGLAKCARPAVHDQLSGSFSILSPAVSSAAPPKFEEKMQSSHSLDKDSLMSMLTAAKEKAEAERLLPALPAEYTSPMQMMVQSFMQRKSWEGRLAKNEFQIRQTFLGQEAYYSSTPLDKLKPSTYEYPMLRN
jgi:hypothetical protein